MKTFLTCFGILMVALMIGRWQGSRIEVLEHRIESTSVIGTTKASNRAERADHASYRTKYVRRSAGVTATQAYESLVAIPRPQTQIAMGPNAALENREALQVIMQLDLSGLDELITLIANSEHPALVSPYREEKAFLCLIAMADVSAREALRYVMEGQDWNRIFARYPESNFMLSYVLARMVSEDPQSALDAMLDIRDQLPEAVGKAAMSRLLEQIARYDPGLLLDSMDQLPDADRPQRVLQWLSNKLKSDDEFTALFHAYRNRYSSQPERMKEVLTAFCGRFAFIRESPPEVRRWMDEMGFTDAEKLLMFDGLKQIHVTPADGEEYAKWFARFMPESKERDVLILKALGKWEEVDPAGARAFVTKQGLDPERMMEASAEMHSR